MSIDYPAHDSMFLEEVTISHMLEMVAIVNVLEQKGLSTKQASGISSPNLQEEFGGVDLEMCSGWRKRRRTDKEAVRE